jgi:hypothetical protein
VKRGKTTTVKGGKTTRVIGGEIMREKGAETTREKGDMTDGNLDKTLIRGAGAAPVAEAIVAPDRVPILVQLGNVEKRIVQGPHREGGSQETDRVTELIDMFLARHDDQKMKRRTRKTRRE